jgi:hypothetical protein
MAASAAADEVPRLSLPLTCEPHKTCFIQSYVDIDSGPGVKDYACGSATYDQHSGVDFRVLSAEATVAGIPVVAAADGVVKGLRDGVRDVFLKEGAKDEIKGRECGNGVVLDHGGGWETQYCHMKSGSVRVTKGQALKRGMQLGEVGFSGAADFAHVHLSVRRDGKVVDPFLPDAANGACLRDAKGPGLWEPQAAAAFPYRNGEIISAGFAGAPPEYSRLEKDHRAVEPLSATAPALLVYGRFVNLIKGDMIRLVATGPGGGIIEEVSKALDRDKATFVSYAGKKRGDVPWPPGRYEGRVELVRDGGVIATTVLTANIP